MRTVGLTLIGQYLTGELPQDASIRAVDKLNKSISRIQSPYFKSWIDLLRTLDKYGHGLGLDFFPDFAAAMGAEEASRVDVPRHYGLDGGEHWQGLHWLDAFLALRNASAHSGSSRDDVCVEDLRIFRPILDQLLATFSFLKEFDLLVLRSPLDETEAPLVITLRGIWPAEPAPVEMDDPLYKAFRQSPVIMRSPHRRLQGLFPLFHAHLEGEPLRCYDGHYLLDSERMKRRTIYYLGSLGRRWPLDDEDAAKHVNPPGLLNAGQKLGEMLSRRAIKWRIRREDVAPWTIRDTVCDYARRTLADLTGIKYLPENYLDRPALSRPLREVALAKDPTWRALLLSGRAGTGKTALLCDLTATLLALEKEEDLVFFVRGDGFIPDLPGGDILLANFIQKIGLEPNDFPTFSTLFSALEQKKKEDHLEGRLFVIILDALNESPDPKRIFREALNLVSVSQGYPWVRIILSVREEFLAVVRSRAYETEKSPFAETARYFLPPPELPGQPRRPEDPPAWSVPAFTLEGGGAGLPALPDFPTRTWVWPRVRNAVGEYRAHHAPGVAHPAAFFGYLDAGIQWPPSAAGQRRLGSIWVLSGRFTAAVSPVLGEHDRDHRLHARNGANGTDQRGRSPSACRVAGTDHGGRAAPSLFAGRDRVRGGPFAHASPGRRQRLPDHSSAAPRAINIPSAAREGSLHLAR
jgi:hypothetical protein